ncbi:MAG TPA: glycosyltransferase family 39 protein, partial [Anaerolineae bacterium]|nr:glycosyltransferase family 39 protein [Anaerolineae bacterium]
VHSDAEAFPYRGTVLAVHAARLVSALLGTLVVLVTYHLGRLLFPHKHAIALGAIAINAFSPSFLFMSGVINNDIMVTLFCSLSLLFSVRVILRGPGLRDLLALGVSTGLALLSKNNALALLPVVAISIGLAVTKVLRHRRSLRLPLVGVAVLLISTTLVSSWWFLRSVALFGTPIARSEKIISRFVTDLRDPGAGLRKIDWQLLPEGLSYFYKSFWASFGWGNILAESWLYLLTGILCLAGICGFVLFLLGKASLSAKWSAVLLLLAFVLFFLLAVYRTLAVRDPSMRGRYALPTISGVSVLLSLGVFQLTPRRLGRLPLLLVGVCMLLLGFVAPFRYIMPVYARPPILSVEQAAQEAVPLDFYFGDKVGLIGYQVGVDRAKAGQFVPITLYWRCLSEMRQNYTVGISLLAPDGSPHGQVAAFTGHGNYPTSLWIRGQIIKDTYQVRVSPGYPAPSLASFYVALYAYPSEEHLPVFDSQGDQIGHAAIFSRLPVDRAQPHKYDLQNPLDYQLGDNAVLIGYDIDDTLTSTGYGCFTLYWRALREMTADYTVFVHIIGQEGQTVAQRDSPPRGGSYPTSYWQEDQIIPDRHCLRFPVNVQPGRYKAYAGMYLLETMQRLPVSVVDGPRVRDDMALLLEWETTSPSTRAFLPLVLHR